MRAQFPCQKPLSNSFHKMSNSFHKMSNSFHKMSNSFHKMSNTFHTMRCCRVGKMDAKTDIVALLVQCSVAVKRGQKIKSVGVWTATDATSWNHVCFTVPSLLCGGMIVWWWALRTHVGRCHTNSFQNMTFCENKFNQSMDSVTLPNNLQNMTFSNNFNQINCRTSHFFCHPCMSEGTSSPC